MGYATPSSSIREYDNLLIKLDIISSYSLG